MTINQITEYVLHTPYNTNKAVLFSMLETLIKDNGSSEKILYMDADLLNAGGPYPVDADDYTTAVIPAEATFVDVEAFANLPNVDTLIVNGDCEFEGYEVINDKTTTYYSAFTWNRIPIRKLIMRDRTAAIPAYFMNGAGPLIEAELSGDVGESSFSGCNYLKKATLANCLSIGDRAFSGCSKLAEIAIPAGVAYIYHGAFSGCSKLAECHIPDSMRFIGGSAFYNCALTEVTIPAGVDSIGSYAFRECDALGKVTILDGVSSIGSGAFWGCSALTEITIPDSVTSIGNSAFGSCSSLTEITIPSDVVAVETNAFNGCTNLKTITILGMETTIAGTSAIPSTTVIRAYAGSAAETFATENSYTFEVIE